MCACGRWWSVWEPETLCGARDALCIFGELVMLSGIIAFRGWIIAHSETLNVQFSGCVVGRFMDMGRPLPLLPWWKLGEVILRGWKPRLCAIAKLRGSFGGMWKLERLV